MAPAGGRAQSPVGGGNRVKGKEMTEPQSMVSWGLDLSTNPKKCAAVAIRWDHGRPEVVDVRTPLKPDAIVDLIFSEDAPFAVDVPFG